MGCRFTIPVPIVDRRPVPIWNLVNGILITDTWMNVMMPLQMSEALTKYLPFVENKKPGCRDGSVMTVGEQL